MNHEYSVAKPSFWSTITWSTTSVSCSACSTSSGPFGVNFTTCSPPKNILSKAGLIHSIVE